MLKRLSANFQKEIALGFTYLFLLSGISTLKAATDNRLGNYSYRVNSERRHALSSRGHDASFGDPYERKHIVTRRNEHNPVNAVAIAPDDLRNIKLPFTIKKKNAPLIGGPGQPANSAIGFYFTNQFKGYIGEEYAKSPENKSGKGIHTVSYFSPALGVIRSVEVKAKVYIENSGLIHIRSKVNLESLPTVTPNGTTPAAAPAIRFSPSTREVIPPPVEN